VDLRRIPFRVLVVAALVPLLLVGTLLAVRVLSGSATTPTAVGSVAPDIELTDLDGATLSLAELRGRPVIVNFWASWCAPCLQEFPLLRDTLERHRDDGLAIVGIVHQDRSSTARAFIERTGATWPSAMDPDERVASAYTILGPPETYFIGRDGRIVARHIGQMSAASLDEKVAAIIDER
jgi:cytochrome c biogenesis protein CcmG/thiol:disulfide interchange protein DsbE